MTTLLDRSHSDIVLIVDDVPENLAMLHDALDEAGYTVLVATNGESALQRARNSLPEVILLDAIMPGMDGFEVARRLKADAATQHIPIVFMTGLTETEHVVSAFTAGVADYVTKPIRPQEVLARIAAHMRNARQTKQARSALDAFGQATISLSADTGRLTWQTPLARKLLKKYFDSDGDWAPARLLEWLDETRLVVAGGREPPLLSGKEGQRLRATPHAPNSPDHEGEWLVVLREESDTATIEALSTTFHVTTREAEVLHWVTLGKTSKDIAEILGMSPRTVNKHLEHVFEKLGVETRTAAANLVMARLGGSR